MRPFSVRPTPSMRMRRPQSTPPSRLRPVNTATARPLPSLKVTSSDGSGRAVAVFTGRKRLGGVDCGRRIVVDGVGRTERGRMVVLNPAYTIVE